MFPVYREKEFAETLTSSYGTTSSANMGLLFDKFPDMWQREQIGLTKKTESIEFLDKIVGVRGDGSVERLLQELNVRTRGMVKELGGLSFSLKTDWRLVTGLGQPHPSETGFRWDRNIGVPYLPASSIRGAVRAAVQEGAFEESLGAAAKRLFEAEGLQAMTLLDANPVTKPKLEVDILNVHYKDYYEGKAPPADYLSPNPVFFLTVARGTEFSFHLLSDQVNMDDMVAAKSVITTTAEMMGFGAKTSIGYGRLVPTAKP